MVVDDGALGAAGETPSDFEARVTTMKADVAAQLDEAKTNVRTRRRGREARRDD